MTLHRCPASDSDLKNNNLTPLALICAWLLAEDKYLLKYKQLWFNRGFDVLIVKTSPLDSLLPPIGCKKVAKNVVKVLTNLNCEYNEMVVHGFSVGIYLFGEVLLQLFERSPEKHSKLIESFKGVIMDSLVVPGDAQSGMALTLTNSPILQSFIKKTIVLFHTIFYDFTAKHYENSGQTFIEPPLKCPGTTI